jgi:DNA-binding response OmpR family regulator
MLREILVVEDDPDAAGALADALKDEGYRVRVAFDGEQGLDLLHERLPDLVLLDVEMPVLDGPGMVVQMLMHDAGLEEVPVLLFSGSPDVRRIAAELGTPYALGKPANYDQLMDLVERALSERRPPTPPVLAAAAAR